jgi:hypothetical protein
MRSKPFRLLQPGVHRTHQHPVLQAGEAEVEGGEKVGVAGVDGHGSGLLGNEGGDRGSFWGHGAVVRKNPA